MLLQIDFKSGKPVYLQLVDQIRYAAASGGLRTGEPLPSIRPLAEELRVNRNTVAKAYAELESQGVIETVPGKGCFLKESNSPFTKTARQKILTKEIDEAVVAAHHLQVDRDAFLALVKERLDSFERKVDARKSENKKCKTLKQLRRWHRRHACCFGRRARNRRQADDRFAIVRQPAIHLPQHNSAGRRIGQA